MSKTIRIHLIDGGPQGTKIVSMGNWNGGSIVVPRSRLKEAASQKDISAPGIYLLIGNEAPEKPDVYIGEAENVYKRLVQHSADENKDFWNVAVCFVCKDGSLTKAHIKFLESHMYHELNQKGRVEMQNGNNPPASSLPDIDKADALGFYENMALLLGVLGYPFLEETVKNEAKYICKGPDAEATGVYTDEGFVVLKGSIARIQPSESAKDRYLKLRPILEAKGVIVRRDEKTYVFMQDHIFNSPSAAAQNVLARNANGWTEWRDPAGRTLSENERE